MAEPNVYSKFSALGTFIHCNDRELIDGIVAETIDIFGTVRCLFGSNISIEKLWSDTTSVVQVDRDTAVKISTREKADIFWNTEPSVYKLQDSQTQSSWISGWLKGPCLSAIVSVA